MGRWKRAAAHPSHDHTQPPTAAQRAARRSLGSRRLRKRRKANMQRAEQRARSVCWLRGCAGAAGVLTKWRKSNKQTFLREGAVTQKPGKKQQGRTWANRSGLLRSLQGCMQGGVSRRGLLGALMVNSKRVSRCPWGSRWTVAEDFDSLHENKSV